MEQTNNTDIDISKIENYQSKLILTRDKHIINIFSPHFNKSVRYSLKLTRMEKKYRNGEWKEVSQQYDFFKPYSISDIICPEEKFKKLIIKTRQLNPNCHNVSSFIVRMKDAIVYENYIEHGIETQCDVGYYRDKQILTKPLEFYSKNIIKCFKVLGIKVTIRLERNIVNNYNLTEQFCTYLLDSEFSVEEKQKLFNYIIDNEYTYDHFINLVQTYKYNIDSLCKYILHYLEPFEDIQINTGLEMLHDYYNMANMITRDVKKYPKYLRSMHDIISINFKAYKRDYNEILFQKLIKNNMEYKHKEFSVIVPKITKEIIQEGTRLNHCVGSYIDKILENKTYIMFLRLTENIDQSLVTLELKNNKITQAKGSYNRPLNKEEKEFLEQYCGKMKLGLEL